MIQATKRRQTRVLVDDSQTRRAARELAADLAPGSVVALVGPLGAGKTTFVQAAAEALGVSDAVTSPTFVRMQHYRGRVPVNHLDLYRVASAAELRSLGLDEWLDTDGIALVEWADRAAAAFPTDTITVELAFAQEGTGRVMTWYVGRPKTRRKD